MGACGRFAKTSDVVNQRSYVGLPWCRSLTGRWQLRWHAWLTCDSSRIHLEPVPLRLTYATPYARAQVLLQYMGQVMRALLSSATDATARGVAAAGVEVGLPEEVRPRGLRNVWP